MAFSREPYISLCWCAVVEDRAYNIVSTIDNSLGYKAVEKATCSEDRCSITFTQGK